MKKTTPKLLVLLAAAGLWACGSHAEHGHGEDDPGHEEEGHTHEPMFGGALIELGDHEANLEVVLDAEAGELTIYLLDGHAADVVKSAVESMTLTVEPEGGDAFDVTLGHVASALSGESIGDSATYRVQDDRLKGVEHLHGDVRSVENQGTVYENIEINWPAGAHDHEEEDEHSEGEGN